MNETKQITQHANAKDILHILKIGSESFAARENGNIEVQTNFLELLAQNVARLRKQNQKFAIVSSGAVQMGRKSFEEDGLDWSQITKQSLAAEGNVALVKKWWKSFQIHGIKTAQILLNSEVDNGSYIQHAHQLIDNGRLVIFNENDVVATRDREIIVIAKDNDTFAGQIAKDLNAQNLGIFSSINGYIQNYGTDEAYLMKNITLIELNAIIEHESQKIKTISEAGTGGITTKLEGIRILLSQAGYRQAQIINSKDIQSVQNYFNGNHKGTNFTN